jgi:hypothetical protein
MHLLEPLIHLGGLLHGYKIVPFLAGGAPAETGCDHLKRVHAKHFAGGIEIRNHFPDIPLARIAERAREAVNLARERFADFLTDADVLVREFRPAREEPIRVGYPVDLSTPRNFTAFVLIDILVDRSGGSARVSGTVFDHAIDGVPLYFLLHVVLDHILAGGESYIARCGRVPPSSLQRRLDALGMHASPQRWLELNTDRIDSMIPAGAPIDVTDSGIPKLQARLRADHGIEVPCSLIEEGLLAVALGCDSVQDCVARVPRDPSGTPCVTRGYDGLGLVRSRGYRAVADQGVARAAGALADILVRTAAEVESARNGAGRTAVFLERYRRIPRSQKEFFERRLSPAGIAVVSGHELQGSSLSGIDFGIPLGRAGLNGDDISFTAFPVHAEHSAGALAARRRRGLETHITRFSVLLSPLSRRDGRRYLFKSIKCAGRPSLEFLHRLGVPPEESEGIANRDAIRTLFERLYNPAEPGKGRVETLARLFLERLETSAASARTACFGFPAEKRSPARR